MTGPQLKTPVAFMIFKRPETTKAVFNEIAGAKPRKLLVVADGPREGNRGEREKCLAARSIIKSVNWPCEVITNFSDVNLGCRNRISSGLDWVFSIVEEAIILEDDCVPDPSFFRFCADLLERYRKEERVCHIGGTRHPFARSQKGESYYFSRYCHVWGWATWRRAWKKYDLGMSRWPEVRNERWLSDMLGGRRAVRYWRSGFDRMYNGEVDTWDVQWLFAAWIEGSLAIVPTVNLVSNRGFGIDATHTKKDNPFAHMDTENICFPLRHPASIGRNREADRRCERELFSGKPMAIRTMNKLFRALKIQYQIP